MTEDDAPAEELQSVPDRTTAEQADAKAAPARTVRVRYGRLHAFVRQALVRARLRPELASQTADALVGANLSGWDEDGVARLPEIVEGLSTRHLRADPEFRIAASSGGVVVLDGGGGPGPAVAHRAMTEAITAANRHGVGAAAVRGSNRFGAPGHFARLALAHQMVGVALSNGPAAPPGAGSLRGTGSRSPQPPTGYPAALGIAVPTVETSAPLVLNRWLGADPPASGGGAAEGASATEGAAAGPGRAAPPPDASDLELALALEAIVALAGAALPGELVTGDRPDPLHRGTGHLFLAFRVRAFAPWAGFRNRMVERLTDLRRRRLDYPGQAAAAHEEERRTRGVPLDRPTAEALRRLSSHLDLDPPWKKVTG